MPFVRCRCSVARETGAGRAGARGPTELCQCSRPGTPRNAQAVPTMGSSWSDMRKAEYETFSPMESNVQEARVRAQVRHEATGSARRLCPRRSVWHSTRRQQAAAGGSSHRAFAAQEKLRQDAEAAEVIRKRKVRARAAAHSGPITVPATAAEHAVAVAARACSCAGQRHGDEASGSAAFGCLPRVGGGAA